MVLAFTVYPVSTLPSKLSHQYLIIPPENTQSCSTLTNTFLKNRNRTSSYDDAYNSTVYYPDSSSKVEGFHREYADPTYPQDRAESLRCGRGSGRYAASTETLVVQAGDKVSFAAVILPPAFWTSANFACQGVCGSPVSLNSF